VVLRRRIKRLNDAYPSLYVLALLHAESQILMTAGFFLKEI